MQPVMPTKTNSKPVLTPQKKEELEPLPIKPIILKKPTVPTEKVIPKTLKIDYYYLDESMAQQGPIQISNVKAMWEKKQMNGNTYLFGGSMKDWTQIKNISELIEYLE